MVREEKRVEQNTGMNIKDIMLLKKKIGAVLMSALLVVVVLCSSGCTGNSTDSAQGDSQDIDITADASSGTQDGMDVAGDTGGNVVEISDDSGNGSSVDKMVELSFANAGRSNPFLPFGDSKAATAVSDKSLFKFDLIEPPAATTADSSASKIVSTKISGIMFDNYNPSAILNIEGSDYLVRSGDVINGYKVLAISPSTVTVQLGKNVYKAGVGEVVTEGSINYNTVSNLSKKFGGNTGKK